MTKLLNCKSVNGCYEFSENDFLLRDYFQAKYGTQEVELYGYIRPGNIDNSLTNIDQLLTELTKLKESGCNFIDLGRGDDGFTVYGYEIAEATPEQQAEFDRLELERNEYQDAVNLLRTRLQKGLLELNRQYPNIATTTYL